MTKKEIRKLIKLLDDEDMRDNIKGKRLVDFIYKYLNQPCKTKI